MSGVPVLPIQFFGKVTPHNGKKFIVEPVSGTDDNGNPLSVKQIVDYVSQPEYPLVDFHATPVDKNGGNRDSGKPGASPGAGSQS